MDFVLFLILVAAIGGHFFVSKKHNDVFKAKQESLTNAINALEAQLKALKK